jgi:hypothetical protein
MRVKLPIDQTNRIEIYFSGPSMAVKSLMDLDSLLVSSRSPTVVCGPEFLSDISYMRSQRASKYNVIAAIDFEGKTFGGNKIYKFQNLIEADGFDIGLSANKNKMELINEIKVIMGFLARAGKDFIMRWTINTKHGPKHIEECLKAIKESGVKYDLISLLTDGTDCDTSHNIVKKSRKLLGSTKQRMKISGVPQEGFITNDKNLVYQVKAEDLV